MKWNSDKIVKDLEKLLPTGAKISISDDTGGDHDTNEIILKSKSGKDGAWCTGYSTKHCFNETDDTNSPTFDIPYVEIRSFDSDSDGGLSPHASAKTRELYFILNDYFRKKAQIIAHYHEIF